MHEILVKAKENLLSDAVGKFDLIESIFPLPVLLKEKPRQLKKMICEKLLVDPAQINYQTYMSWLRRFRKKHSPSKPPAGEISEELQDWQNFIPSEPASSLQDTPVLLKKIIYQQ